MWSKENRGNTAATLQYNTKQSCHGLRHFFNQFSIRTENYQLFRYSLHLRYFSNCCLYYLYMLHALQLSLYSLFIHSYCFTTVNCIVLHSLILVSCLLCHSCLCDVLILTHFHIQLSANRCWSCETYIYIYVCVCVCKQKKDIKTKH